MSYLSQVKGWLGRPSRTNLGPQVTVFGDSHTAALLRAQEFPDRGEYYKHIGIARLRKEKGEKRVGDVDLERFCASIGRLSERDFVFSAIGGNQYAIVSTVQSAIDFDFLSGPADDDIVSDRAQLVPMRAMVDYIQSGVEGNDGPVLKAIRRSTRAKVFHLAPPPPKEDNSFISQFFESRFAGEGIGELGPSRPQLRLKCWKVQTDCLQRLCAGLDIELVLPPAAALTEQGFLAPTFYAKDATHANRRYGELVLKQILEIVSGEAGELEPSR